MIAASLLSSIHLLALALGLGAVVARRRGRPTPSIPVDRFRIINTVEVALVVAIVFVAPFMARGAWLC